MGRRKRSTKPKYRPYNVGDYRLGWLRGGFCATWYDDGKRRRYQLGVTGETEARTELHAFARAHLKAVDEPGDITAGLFEQYLADREAEGVQVQKLRWKWVILAPTFGHLRPQDITKTTCRDFAARRAELGKKPNTIESELRQLRTLLRWAYTAKLIKDLPIIWVPPRPEPRDRHLTRAEVTQLLHAAELPHIRLFIVLAIATAARMNALLDLTWDRVDFNRGLIYLHDPAKLRTSKGRAIVPMNDTARAALQEAKEGAHSDYVIEWAGGRIKNIRRAISTALVKAGLKAPQDGAHLLRHTAAVLMAENGVPMSEISQYLGHNSTETTERVYARYSPDYLRRAAGVLNLPAVHLRERSVGSIWDSG
jgi:integrase